MNSPNEAIVACFKVKQMAGHVFGYVIKGKS